MNEQYKDYYIQTLSAALNDILYKNFSMQTDLRISNELIDGLKQELSLLERNSKEHIENLRNFFG